jgi:CRP-like cAMP-binding protein
MEHYFEKFFEYIEEIIEMPDEAKLLCKELFIPQFVPKNTILEHAGSIPQYHNFIVAGNMRNFHLDQDGNEITNDLNNDCRFFTSYFHFMNKTVSNESLQCITDCHLLRISRENVDVGASLGNTQTDYTIKILNHHLALQKQMALDIANLSAEELYHRFSKENSNIIKHAPLQYIASYLGITPRHLSRIRKSG